MQPCTSLLLTSTLLLLIFGSALSGGGSKYSKSANDNYKKSAEKKSKSNELSGEFRVKMLAQIFEKLERNVYKDDREQMKKVYSQFKQYDKDLMQAKRKMGEGKDAQGDDYLRTMKQLRQYMRQIKQEHMLDAFHMQFKNVDELALDESPAHRNSGPTGGKLSTQQLEALRDKQYADVKLNQLWTDAYGSGKFSKDELHSLAEEFDHYESRMAEYREAAAELNSVNKVHADAVDHSQFEHKNRELKEANRELRNRMDQLKDKVGAAPYIFQQERVQKMWKSAQLSGNFTPAELESIHEELVHFERKLDKLDHFSEESKRHEKEKKKLMKDEHPDGSAGAFVNKKVLELSAKVEKLGSYLSQKIGHTEL